MFWNMFQLTPCFMSGAALRGVGKGVGTPVDTMGTSNDSRVNPPAPLTPTPKQRERERMMREVCAQVSVFVLPYHHS